MDPRFMHMHNLVLTREVIINSTFLVDLMCELNFHRQTALRGYHPRGSIIPGRIPARIPAGTPPKIDRILARRNLESWVGLMESHLGSHPGHSISWEGSQLEFWPGETWDPG